MVTGAQTLEVANWDVNALQATGKPGDNPTMQVAHWDVKTLQVTPWDLQAPQVAPFASVRVAPSNVWGVLLELLHDLLELEVALQLPRLATVQLARLLTAELTRLGGCCCRNCGQTQRAPSCLCRPR